MMDPMLTEVTQLFGRFKAAFVRNDFPSCEKFLSQLKVVESMFSYTKKVQDKRFGLFSALRVA